LINHPFKESEKLDGFDPYSNSKSCSELVTHCYKRSFFAKPGDCAISTARAGNVLGGGDFSPNRIIPDCVRAACAKQTIEVRNRNSTRPYQFVLEPLFVYLLIAQKQYDDSSFSGSYNIGPDKDGAVTTGDLVRLFCRKWGDGVRWEDKTLVGAPHEAEYLSLDNSLLKKTFGWKPVMNIDKCLDNVIEWSKAFCAGSPCLPVMRKQINDFSRSFTL
jgi:CDP-glucose 4,6-dehydratase